jgi:hypothetical protein
MYATNRMNPDRRDPAEQAGWYPLHQPPGEATAGKTSQARVKAIATQS